MQDNTIATRRLLGGRQSGAVALWRCCDDAEVSCGAEFMTQQNRNTKGVEQCKLSK